MQSSFKILQLKNKNTLNPLMSVPWPLLGSQQHSLDLQLPFYVPLACLFFVLQKNDAPIFFLYYPLNRYSFCSFEYQWETPVMKGRSNKSANCFEISFFRLFGLEAILELREDMMLAISSLSVGCRNIVVPFSFAR